MEQAYDWSSFTVHTYYRAPLERVWRAWATAAGLESFFIGKAVHTGTDGAGREPEEEAHPGDAYHWAFLHPFEIQGEFRVVEPMKRVAFTFGGMETSVELKDLGDAVEVRLRQTGCRTEDPGRVGDHVNCRSCWVYYLTNLKSVLERGADLRDAEQPEWNDAVSIAWSRD